MLIDYLIYSIFFINFFIRISLFFYKVDRVPSFYTDEIVHLGIEKIFIKLKNISPKNEYLNKHFYFTNKLRYPTLYHQLVHFFSPDYSLKFRRRLSNLFGILVPTVFFILMYGYHDLNVLLLVSSFMLVSLNSFGLFSKMYISYTERPFADFLIFSAFILMYLYLLESNTMYLYVSIIPLVMVWFSSKFGIQAIILIPFVYLIMTGDNSLIFVIFISFLVAFLVDKNRLTQVISGHFGHLLWYSRNFEWLIVKSKLKSLQIKDIYVYLTSKVIIKSLLQFIPLYPILLCTALLSYSTNSDFLILSAFIVSMLTIFKPFIFIGPSYRYSWYFLPLILPILINYLLEFFLFFVVLEFILAFYLTYKLLIQKEKKYEDAYLEYQSLIKRLNFENKNILTSPTRISVMHTAISEQLNCKLYAFWNFGTNLDAIRSYEKYMPTYPIITNEAKKLKDMINEYNFDIFIIDKVLTDSFYNKYNAYGDTIENKEILYQSERFLVVQL